jgi:hypothetical protein
LQNTALLSAFNYRRIGKQVVRGDLVSWKWKHPLKKMRPLRLLMEPSGWDGTSKLIRQSPVKMVLVVVAAVAVVTGVAAVVAGDFLVPINM